MPSTQNAAKTWLYLGLATLTSLPLTIMLLRQPSAIASETQTIAMPINQQISYQSNSISISKATLQQPLNLMIETASNTDLTGAIILEEKEIATLEDNLVLDLSRLLQPGKNEIRIQGNYAPKDNSVTVKLTGTNTQSTSTVGGSGILEQRLTINVQ